MNTEDCSGQSIATEARRARGQAAKANSGPGARLRVALQRRLRTYPATPRTANAAATAASDTLANPTNVAYRRRLSLIQTIPPVASPPRGTYIPNATTATAVQSNQVYLTQPATHERVEFCGASDKRFSLAIMSIPSASPTPQERMDAAFDNYIALSDILCEDLVALLDSESDSQQWRRHYIRVSASLIEGYAHCLREMCAVSFECMAPAIGQQEVNVLHSEWKLDANKRIKLTLRAAYKLFELQPAPNFGDPEWPRAQRVLAKRHLLMHPKCPADLAISDEDWNELRDGVTWLVEQLFNFISALKKKHDGSHKTEVDQYRPLIPARRKNQ